MLPVARNDAISVSSSSATCDTEEPNIAGSIRRPILRTPSWPQRQRGRLSSPSLSMNGIRKASCTRPATKTPIASTTPGRSKPGAIHAAKTIMVRFMSVEVSAGAANRP